LVAPSVLPKVVGCDYGRDVREKLDAMVFRAWVLASVAVLASGCLEFGGVQCADGRTCPDGTECVDELRLCVQHEQLTACAGANGGDECTAGAIQGVCGGAALGVPCTTCVCSDPRCGDGFVTAPEQCDTDALGAEPLCNQHGYYETTNVACSPSCTYDVKTSCSRTCGDGLVEASFGEVCDDDVAPLEPCIEYGYDIGFADCISGGCSPDLRQCRRIGWSPVVRDTLTFEPHALASAGGHVFVIADTNTDHLYVWHHDGISWTKVDTGIDISAHSIWAASPTDVYILGSAPDFSATRVAHLSGSTWTSEDLPANSGTVVWGTSSSDVWMFGPVSARHFDGTTWTSFDDVGLGIITSAWASAPNDYWVVGGSGLPYVLYHYNGSTWQTVPTGVFELQGVTGTGTQPIAYGYDVAIWNGSAFVSLNAPLGRANAAWAESPSNIFIIDDNNYVYRYNGIDWTLLFTTTFNALAIGGHSPDGIYVVEASGTIRRYDGNAWRLPPPPQNAAQPYVSVIGANNAVFAARQNAVDVFAGNLVTESALTGVSAVGRAGNDIYAVGSDLIARYTASPAWTADTAPTGFFVAVAGPDAATVFAATSKDIYSRNSDGTWTQQTLQGVPLALNALIHDLWCLPSGTTCAAVGEHVIILWNGSTWTAETISPHLAHVWGAAANDVYAVGNVGVILHFDGATWSPVAIPGETSSFTGVYGTASDDVFLVTDNESLYHFDGRRWSPIRPLNSLGAVEDLWVSAAAIWTVGSLPVTSTPRALVLERTYAW
jgi:hypothetical protein